MNFYIHNKSYKCKIYGEKNLQNKIINRRLGKNDLNNQILYCKKILQYINIENYNFHIENNITKNDKHFPDFEIFFSFLTKFLQTPAKNNRDKKNSESISLIKFFLKTFSFKNYLIKRISEFLKRCEIFNKISGNEKYDCIENFIFKNNENNFTLFIEFPFSFKKNYKDKKYVFIERCNCINLNFTNKKQIDLIFDYNPNIYFQSNNIYHEINKYRKENPLILDFFKNKDFIEFSNIIFNNINLQNINVNKIKENLFNHLKINKNLNISNKDYTHLGDIFDKKFKNNKIILNNKLQIYNDICYLKNEKNQIDLKYINKKLFSI